MADSFGLSRKFGLFDQAGCLEDLIGLLLELQDDVELIFTADSLYL